MAIRTKAAARQKADGKRSEPTTADAATEYFKALCVPPDAIPGLVAKVTEREVLFAECDRLADEWRRGQGGGTWLEILRGKPPVSLPSLVSFRASVALWRAWYRNSPGDFLDLAGKLRELWNQARLVEGMSPPPPLPAAARGVMPGRDRAAVEISLAALESLLRWCDGIEQPAAPAVTNAPAGEAEDAVAPVAIDTTEETEQPVAPAVIDNPDESGHVWLSTAEAAAYAGRCSKTITNWIRGGTLHSYGQTGTRYQFLKSELDAKKFARKPHKPR